MKKTIAIILIVQAIILGCQQLPSNQDTSSNVPDDSLEYIIPDTSLIPRDAFGDAVRYGRNLMEKTAFFIGPKGSNGQYTRNLMACSNCHQQAGTKPFSFNLMRSHQEYPQYRPREDKILTLAERVNNCITRPHNGRPLPYESKEMIAFLSYLKWINSFVIRKDRFAGEKNLQIQYPDIAANAKTGSVLYTQHCERCHQKKGEGLFNADTTAYLYPPLWGDLSYRKGSSMNRVTKMAGWLKANMPHQLASHTNPVLSDVEALHIAAFINDESIHSRPGDATYDYPNPLTKPMDYDKGPYADPFSEEQHKNGPFPPIIKYWEEKGQKLVK